MSTTPRNPPPSKTRQRVKRKEVQADDGWTVVTHKPSSSNSSSRGSRNTRNAKSRSQALALEHARPTQIAEGLTKEALLATFAKFETRFNELDYARNLASVLNSKDWKVGNAVCIGIGSFSLDWENRHRSMWQLVLFVSVLKIILKTEDSRRNIKVYAQEPAFTSLDTEFLASLDIPIITVEKSVEGYITPSTFFYSPFVDWTLLLPVFLKGKDPVLYVGNEIQEDYKLLSGDAEKEAVREDCEKIGKQFLAGRDMAKVHAGTESGGVEGAVQGLVIYWKKGEGAGVDSLVEKLEAAVIE